MRPRHKMSTAIIAANHFNGSQNSNNKFDKFKIEIDLSENKYFAGSGAGAENAGFQALNATNGSNKTS